jgi:hypothetical protein
MKELVFEITQESDGGFVADALGESIITQADTWEELRVNVREAVNAFYFDQPAPSRLPSWLGAARPHSIGVMPVSLITRAQ